MSIIARHSYYEVEYDPRETLESVYPNYDWTQHFLEKPDLDEADFYLRIQGIENNYPKFHQSAQESRYGSK